jgi:hypothetical protein
MREDADRSDTSPWWRMTQTTFDSHYVPKAYLARWSQNGRTVWEHKLVVPHERYPLWRAAPLREACMRRYVYDTQIPGLARDHFEAWFQREVETPAYNALRRLENDEKLSRSEMDDLVRFAIAQDLRTLKDREKYDALIKHEFPIIAERAIKAAVRAYNPRLVPTLERNSRNPPSDESPLFNTKIVPNADGASIEVSLLAGASLWMQRTKRLVREFLAKASRHDWQILQPYPGRKWPTSDHPLVRFERRQGVAIHGTGWFRRRTEVFLPLTPQHALYTIVGVKPHIPVFATLADTHLFVRLMVVRLMVGHAYRSVFATEPGYKWIEWERRRCVDRDLFNEGW